MKSILIGIAITVISLTACNNDSNKSTGENKKDNDTMQTMNAEPKPALSANGTDTKASASTKEIAGHYFHLKNALANDDGKDAANAGKAIVEAIGKVDTASLTSDQKKVYKDLEDDMRENAEHIGANAGKIEHQREHFEMLSKDMYDLVKTFGAGQTVYQDFCPMYNNKKGATWISETKAIKNPYLGKEMPTCGTVKEEIK